MRCAEVAPAEFEQKFAVESLKDARYEAELMARELLTVDMTCVVEEEASFALFCHATIVITDARRRND